MLFLHRFRQTETSFGNVRCGIQVIYHFSELSVAIEKIFQQVKRANAHFSLENGAIDQISQQHSVSNLVHHKSLFASFVLKETLKFSEMKMQGCQTRDPRAAHGPSVTHMRPIKGLIVL